jgi:hypothetical protein
MIIGVDPGKTTGIAVFFNGQIIDVGEVPARQVADRVRSIVANVHNDVVVELAVERYIISAETGKRSQQPDALYVIGELRALAHGWSLTAIHLQNPADAKKCATNKTLRRLGWWVGAAYPHANDALRHVALRLLATHPDVYAKLLGV